MAIYLETLRKLQSFQLLKTNQETPVIKQTTDQLHLLLPV